MYISAHFHHMIEKIRMGVPFKNAAVVSSKKILLRFYAHYNFLNQFQFFNFLTPLSLDCTLHFCSTEQVYKLIYFEVSFY